jgi:very-short-patch-repair endonuclease
MPPPPPTPSPSDEAIARALHAKPHGVDPMTLARQLGASQLVVQARLLVLLERCLVEYVAGRWRWRGGALPAPPTAPRFGRGAGATATPMDATSRWAIFRKLCRYYVDAIHHEDRGELTLHADPQSTEYRTVAQPPDWSALECGHTVPITVPGLDTAFLAAVRHRNHSGPWLLGVAIDAVPQQDGRPLLHPLVLVPVALVAREDQTVRVRAEGPVGVNHGWQQARGNELAARQASKALAFLGDVVRSDAATDGSALGLCAVQRACLELTARRPTTLREPLQPDRPSQGVALHSVSQKGLYNRVLLIAPRKLKYTARLASELLALADAAQTTDEALDQTALAAIFPHEAPKGRPAAAAPPAEPPLVAEDRLLNDEQRQAVAVATTARLGVLTGPPGTGKSTTVAHVMMHLARQGRPVLMASRNHQAIEAVEPRLNEIVHPDLAVLRPARRRHDAATQEWQAAMAEMLARPTAAHAASDRDAAAARLDDALRRRAAAETQLGRLLDLGDALAKAEAQLRACTQATQTAPPPRTDLAALPPPELVVAATDALAGLLAPRPWWRRWLRALTCAPLRLVKQHPQQRVLARCEALLAAFRAHGCRLRANVPVSGLAPELAEALRLAAAGAAARAADDLVHEVTAMRPRDTLEAELDAAIRQVHDATKAWLRAFVQAAGSAISAATKQRFHALRAGLANHDGDTLAGKFESELHHANKELLRHFPMWAVSNLSARKAAPLEAGIFDLLVLDESSQCDIPSVVPLLFRAKRALIVGDPMQLGHISTLGAEADQRMRRQHGVVGDIDLERFSVRTNSMFALADSAAGREAVMLRGHYRCHPDIAGYFNSAFYRGALRVRTNSLLPPLPGWDGAAGIEWIDTVGTIHPATTGCTRDAEATAIAELVQRLAAAGFRHSLGVVTPFRAQAERIEREVANRLSGNALDRLHFRVHTVDGFQGDERDVMLFSLCAGADMPAGAHGFLAREHKRINVAVSRARRHLRVFGDRRWASQCGIPHVQDLLLACENATTRAGGRPDLVGPEWEPRFAEALRDAVLPIHQQFVACGHHIDIALVSDRKKLAIEVDGETWHQDGEGRRLVDDLHRDHVLREAGWIVRRFWVHQLREGMHECVDAIRRLWEETAASGGE